MKRLFILVMAVATLMTVAAGIAFAAPPEKKDVCHYDTDAGTYRLINLPANALQRHLGHGDWEPGDAIPASDQMRFGPD